MIDRKELTVKSLKGLCETRWNIPDYPKNQWKETAQKYHRLCWVGRYGWTSPKQPTKGKIIQSVIRESMVWLWSGVKIKRKPRGLHDADWCWLGSDCCLRSEPESLVMVKNSGNEAVSSPALNYVFSMKYQVKLPCVQKHTIETDTRIKVGEKPGWAVSV